MIIAQPRKTRFAPNRTRSLMRCAGLLSFLSWLVFAAPAVGQQNLVVEVGKGLRLGRVANAESVFVADPSIADITSSPGEAVYVHGKAPGETTIIAADIAGKTLFQYNLVVVHNLSEIRRALNKRFAGEAVTLSSARGSVYVSGTVSDERTHQDVLATVRAAVPDGALIDEISVAQSQIVQLEVKLLEVRADQLERHGINWSILAAANTNKQSGNLTSVDSVISLLIANGVATVAAESTLATVSNRKANFSVGEELAMPVFAAGDGSDARNFSVDFKFVGIDLSFTPVVLPSGKISLEIASEASSAQATARQINGNSFPNLVARKFTTNVDLESGRSFVVAGLSRLDTSANIQKPREGFGANALRTVIGKDQIESAQRDLVVVVTPRVAELQKPSVKELLPSSQTNLEFILDKKVHANRRSGSASVKLVGPAGFVY
ncbi:pilus assembly protein N-terminal domain-containing protein [Ensifer sp. SL37]|uniref:pilus assembly protein N-terminal domain-containing protein n=1 Tax=Ensifer sp. SL37 TaxID=2995137 RepID=UPI002275E1BC|nr:pilus assembly protein N-terminal domain-containing protein [Ensifer sp. SL37]MCY1740488.1 pilus assembly protein N-terminal domain-containing protein [Ensifer sp. SL37]